MSEKKRVGNTVSIVGIVLNFMLAASKIIFGVLFGIVSLTADGANNLSDCGSGVVSLVSFRIAEKPADKEHPYGHQRAEYIAAMFIGFFVLLIAVELLRESIEKIVTGTVADTGYLVYILLGVSVAAKGGMFAMYRIAGKKFDSDVLKAAALDSVCDCIATAAVAAGMLVSDYAGFPADGIAGLVVVLFIVWEGVGIVKNASSRLLGQAPAPAFVERLKETVLQSDGVLGVHDLRVYRYGPNKYFATVHVEMDVREGAETSHAKIDALERRVLRELGTELTAHFDPVDPTDSEAKELEEKIRAAIDGIYEEMDLHDFRLVRGERKKIVFEVGVPFDLKIGDDEVAATLTSAVRVLTDAEPVITVERE